MKILWVRPWKPRTIASTSITLYALMEIVALISSNFPSTQSIKNFKSTTSRTSILFREGCLYCQAHYQEKFCSKCFKCEDYIMGVNAVEGKFRDMFSNFSPVWRPWTRAGIRSTSSVTAASWYFLTTCPTGRRYYDLLWLWLIVLSSKVWFSLKPWTLQDTRPYCEHCYQDTVLPKCGGCRWRSKIRKGSILKSHISETRSQTRLLKLSTSTGTPSALSARWVIHNRSHVMEHTVLKFYCFLLFCYEGL